MSLKQAQDSQLEELKELHVAATAKVSEMQKLIDAKDAKIEELEAALGDPLSLWWKRVTGQEKLEEWRCRFLTAAAGAASSHLYSARAFHTSSLVVLKFGQSKKVLTARGRPFSREAGSPPPSPRSASALRLAFATGVRAADRAASRDLRMPSSMATRGAPPGCAGGPFLFVLQWNAIKSAASRRSSSVEPRGSVVPVERLPVIPPHLEREFVTPAENASRHGDRFAHQ